VLAGDAGRLQMAPGISAHQIVDLEAHQPTGDILVLTEPAGVWLYEFAGQAFRPADGLPGTGTATVLVPDPADTDRYLMGQCQGGVRESLDAGQSWSVSGTGSGTCVQSLAFAPDNPDRVYSGHGEGVAVSDDRGQNFQDLLQTGQDVMAVVALPDDRLVYHVFPRTVRLREADGSLSTLADCVWPSALVAGPGGDTWILCDSGIRVLPEGASAVEQRSSGSGSHPQVAAFIDEVLYLGYDSLGVLVSVDGGRSFTDAGCPIANVTALLSDPSGGSLLVGTRGRGLLRYNPDGP
jgi:hypothetical protein